MQITKKNTGTPMFMGYGKRIFKKVNICITDSLGYTPEVNTSEIKHFPIKKIF